jgi:predicted transcriptional regulator
MRNRDVETMFLENPKLQLIPVVDDGVPVGIIDRYRLIDSFARPFQREVQGKKPAKSLWMKIR